MLPRTVNVEVTVDDAAMNPPKSLSVAVAMEPRSVTDKSVSDSVAAKTVPVAKGAQPVLVLTPVSLIYIRPFVESITKSPTVPVTLPSGRICEIKYWISSAKFSSVNTGVVETAPDETCSLVVGEIVPIPTKPSVASALKALMPLGRRFIDPSPDTSMEPFVVPPLEEMLIADAPALPIKEITASSPVELTVKRATPLERVIMKFPVLVPPAN